MEYDFFESLECVDKKEDSDYSDILNSWSRKAYHIAFMPSIFWYSGTFNLFDQKGGVEGKDMIWIVPAGQNNFFWLPKLRRQIENFYENDEIEFNDREYFTGIEAEEFEEIILLHSDNLQNDPEHTILGANVLLIRLSLSSGRDTILFILLDHHDNCWKNIIEGFNIPLTWMVDSGRGTDDYFTRIDLYQLMKNTPYPETLPSLYFKGLYNKGEVPEGFKFLYAMLSEPDADGYDSWQHFSAVYDTGWKKQTVFEDLG